MRLKDRFFSRDQITLFAAMAFIYLATWALVFSGLFRRMSDIDVFLHFTGGFLIALFIANALYGRGNLSRRRAWMIIALTLLIGIVWELYEWLLDFYLDDYFRGIGLRCCIGDLNDSIKDLVMDTLGAILALFMRPKLK